MIELITIFAGDIGEPVRTVEWEPISTPAEEPATAPSSPVKEPVPAGAPS